MTNSLCATSGSLAAAAVRAYRATRSTKGRLRCFRFVVHCFTSSADAEGSTSEDEDEDVE